MGLVFEDPRLRNRTSVFTDRHDAGRQLAELIRTHPAREPVVLAIPAGGIPVGTEIARAIRADFGLAVVRKIQVPGNPESGFGAVTWDGRVLINEPFRESLGMSTREVEQAISSTRRNIEDRITRFTGGRPFPEITGRTVFVVDDGLASGFTMLAAIASIKEKNPQQVNVAVPTASRMAADKVGDAVDRLYCANIRSGSSFAVADAYKKWHDLNDNEALAELSFFRQARREPDFKDQDV